MAKLEFYTKPGQAGTDDPDAPVYIRIPVDSNNVIDRPATIEDFEKHPVAHGKFLAGLATGADDPADSDSIV